MNILDLNSYWQYLYSYSLRTTVVYKTKYYVFSIVILSITFNGSARGTDYWITFDINFKSQPIYNVILQKLDNSDKNKCTGEGIMRRVSLR